MIGSLAGFLKLRFAPAWSWEVRLSGSRQTLLVISFRPTSSTITVRFITLGLPGGFSPRPPFSRFARPAVVGCPKTTK
jgi:hypothetical protein